jgi:hypothetical protein
MTLWITALQIYNKKRENWIVPKRGTPEYNDVMKIMNKLKEDFHNKKTSTMKKRTRKRKIDDTDDMDGEGLKEVVEKVKSTARNVIDAIINGVRKGASPNLKDMIKKYGDKAITSASVQRAPIDKAIRVVADVLTSGKFSKTAGDLEYDDVYHLSLILTLDNGKIISYEKNDVVVIKENPQIKGEQMAVNLKNITLANFINNTIQAIGEEKFYLYTAEEFNCQHFIHAHLKVNKALTPALNTFIMQDAISLLQRNPKLISLFKKVTDIGALFNIVKEGRGVYFQK